MLLFRFLATTRSVLALLPRGSPTDARSLRRMRQVPHRPAAPPFQPGPPAALLQLGSLSAQREGLRQRATQSDAALQQLAINEGEAMLELQQARAQVGHHYTVSPVPAHGHQL